MVYSSYAKMRALHFRKRGCRAPTIAAILKKEGFKGVLHKFLKNFQERGTIHRLVNLKLLQYILLLCISIHL